jgi:hypothetical protein
VRWVCSVKDSGTCEETSWGEEHSFKALHLCEKTSSPSNCTLSNITQSKCTVSKFTQRKCTLSNNTQSKCTMSKTTGSNSTHVERSPKRQGGLYVLKTGTKKIQRHWNHIRAS